MHPLRETLLLVALVLSACDNPPTCRSKCPNPAETRDFFCGCFDAKKRDEEQVKQSNNQKPAPVYSQCVCQYSGGVVGAWFNYRPSVFGSTDALTVSSSTCADLTFCELFRTSDGREFNTVLTGKMRIAPDSWGETTNISGNKVWRVIGKFQGAAQSPSKEPLSGPRFALHLNQLRRMIIPAGFTNDVSGCTQACATGSPYCLNHTLTGIESAGLKQLYSKLLTKPNRIEAKDIQKMFAVQSDECERSDTNLGSHISNTGAACTLVGQIASLKIDASIQIPTSLYGRYSFSQDGLASLAFDDEERRPRLSFSDKFVQADWGGDVNHVFGTANYIGFSVGRESCLMLALK